MAALSEIFPAPSPMLVSFLGVRGSSNTLVIPLDPRLFLPQAGNNTTVNLRDRAKEEGQTSGTEKVPELESKFDRAV